MASQRRNPHAIGGFNAAVGVGLEGAQASAAKPGQLRFGFREAGAGRRIEEREQPRQFRVEPPQNRVAANQIVHRISRRRAIGRRLIGRRRDGRRPVRLIGEENGDRQKTDAEELQGLAPFSLLLKV